MGIATRTRFGPYEVRGAIGAGGMGEVYRATDTRLGRDVALKVLPSDVATDADRLARFAQEARTVSALNHPNIVTVYDVGVGPDPPFVVFELLEGMTLREALDDHRISLSRALDYAVQIAQALGAAHERGIIHGDLKPENVFVTAEGRVKILDFGLAKKVEPAPAGDNTARLPPRHDATSSAGLGTPGYMSPEQVYGKIVDQRSDIFSLGATLYEMLAGRRAFQAASAVETMNAIVTHDPPPLVTLNPRVPDSVERVVRRCLEKRVEARFQSARDLAFALETASPLPASGSVVRRQTSRRRRRWLAALVFAGIAVALAGAALLNGFTVFSTPPPKFNQLTFRRGLISSARFLSDRHTILYTAAWDGGPWRIYQTRAGNLESLELPLTGWLLLAASPSGELAVLESRRGSTGLMGRFAGTLGVVQPGGAAVRRLAEEVFDADWAPDGKNLAVVRRDGLEFPLGTVIYRPPANNLLLFSPRISPEGDLVAFLEQEEETSAGWVSVVDHAGHKRQLSSLWTNIEEGLAWTPDGQEVWFNASALGSNLGIHAVTLRGRERVVQQAAGSIRLRDLSRDGNTLVTSDWLRGGMAGVAPGETTERDLSWFDGPRPRDLAADGKTLLFDESGATGARAVAYVRGTDGSPAVRLGEGLAMALSPDGRWALCMSAAGPPALILLPTGAGDPKRLDLAGIQPRRLKAGWLPDSSRIVFTGAVPQHADRLFLLDLGGGSPGAITPEGWRGPTIVSPDGSRVTATNSEGKVSTYPIAGGEPRPVTGSDPGDIPLRWSSDGRSLYVRPLRSSGSAPPAVYRLDLQTGRRESWKQVTHQDQAGIDNSWFVMLITPDGKSYVYGYARMLSDLYLAEGLR